MADSDVPPLEDVSDMVAAVKVSAPRSTDRLSAPGKSTAAASTLASTSKSLSDKEEFLTNWGTPEEEVMQKQMIDAALAREPEYQEDMRKKEKEVTDNFLSGTSFKKGFLLSSSKKSTEKKAAVPASAAPSDDIPLIAPKVSKDATKVIPEVQEAMKAGMSSLQRTVTDKSWMTPELLEKISKEPKLVMGMTNPRCMAALAELQKDPKAAMEKYKDDAMLQDFLRAFMGIMGDHFLKLGEAEKAKAAAAEASAPVAAPGMTVASTKRTSAASTPKQDIVKATDMDDDVRDVLSNPMLLEILRNPVMQRVLEECRIDGTRLRHYMGIPEVRVRLLVLQKAGLIRIDM